MSRIKEAFKDGKALIGFLTAGVPSAEDTLRYMGDLETAGANLIEIGVPFSDPVADGAVIMEADVQALKNKVHLASGDRNCKSISETVRNTFSIFDLLQSYI